MSPQRSFAEKAYDGTTLQHIADRTGILKDSIYYYITTKSWQPLAGGTRWRNSQY